MYEIPYTAVEAALTAVKDHYYIDGFDVQAILTAAMPYLSFACGWCGVAEAMEHRGDCRITERINELEADLEEADYFYNQLQEAFNDLLAEYDRITQ